MTLNIATHIFSKVEHKSLKYSVEQLFINKLAFFVTDEIFGGPRPISLIIKMANVLQKYFCKM